MANGVFELPGGFSLGALLATNTGRPFNTLIGSDDNGDGNANDRAVVDDSNRQKVLDMGLDLPEGLQPRNSGRQPGVFNLDLRVAKNVEFGKKGRMELMVEVFNVFNNANRFTTSNVIGSPSFGRLDSVGTPRQVQLGARYRW